MTKHKKIKILATGDWMDSGFGTVMRNLWPRLSRTGLFEIHLVGWHYRGNLALAKEALDSGIILHPTLSFEDGGPGPMHADLTGALTCKSIVQALKPDIFWALGDPWQLIPFLDPEFDDAVRIFYTPIDTDTVSIPDLKGLMRADVLVLYSQFGVDVFKRQAPFTDVEMIYHGVDQDTFRLLPDSTVKKFKMGQRWGLPEGVEPWVVLCVGMNQTRKAHPRTLAAFKAATCAVFNAPEIGEDGTPNEIGVPDPSQGAEVVYSPPSKWCEEVQQMRCDKCPYYQADPAKDHWVLHFHCSQDGQGTAGWNMVELAHRFGMEGRMRCSDIAAAHKGVPPKVLARLMNAADVHMMLTHREGFGLPIVETMACGTPNIVTGYSSCEELIEQGGGHPVKVKDFNTNHFHGAVDAMADIADAARALVRMYEDPEWHAAQRQKGLEFTATLDWDRIAMDWVDLLRKAASEGKKKPVEEPEPESEPAPTV